ncbi:hypothetical protein [Peterkaempfera griseoplana]|uniref:hypothetical protein n=1 Tax=Peterkaempfera griseoplana TaxID=66896 RepID=UPI0006E45361|nr:hypothetical protein [Peterkaempfera griseoplana]
MDQTTPSPAQAFGPPAPQPQPQPQPDVQPPVAGAPVPPPAGAFGAPVPPPAGQFGAPLPPPSPYLQAPAPAASPTTSRAALGLLAGVAAALVGAAVYGGIIRGTNHEFSYAALAVGALVGAALGKVGGRSQTLPILGVPLALLGVFLGQMFGLALLAAHDAGMSVSVVLSDHAGVIYDLWKDQLSPMDVLFFGIAGVEGFLFAKRTAG